MTNSISQMKDEARRLRDGLAGSGSPISHSQSLELVARQKGYRDWNTLYGDLGHSTGANHPSGLSIGIGQSVEGTYLGQPFKATVLGVQSQLQPDRFRITLELSEPVDVVTFESFSAFRRRISATINSDGRTSEKTSNGEPQLVLCLARQSSQNRYC